VLGTWRYTSGLIALTVLGCLWLLLHTVMMVGSAAAEQRMAFAAATLEAEALAAAVRYGRAARQRDTLVVHRGAAFRLVVSAEEALPGYERVQVEVFDTVGARLRELNTVLPAEDGR